MKSNDAVLSEIVAETPGCTRTHIHERWQAVSGRAPHRTTIAHAVHRLRVAGRLVRDAGGGHRLTVQEATP